AVTFAAVNFALTAWLGGVGRIIGVALVVAAVAGRAMSTVPAWFDSIAPMLPLTPAMNGVAAFAAGAPGVGAAVGGLMGWLGLAGAGGGRGFRGGGPQPDGRQARPGEAVPQRSLIRRGSEARRSMRPGLPRGDAASRVGAVGSAGLSRRSGPRGRRRPRRAGSARPCAGSLRWRGPAGRTTAGSRGSSARGGRGREIGRASCRER